MFDYSLTRNFFLYLVFFNEEGEKEEITNRPPTFTESLQLDEHYLEEFLGGNFVYLRPKIGLQRTAYDLECVEHFETNPNDYYTMSKQGRGVILPIFF